MDKKEEDLILELSEDEREFFESLAPSYRKNFVMHAFSGKREETVLKNIEEVKGALELKCKNIFDYKKKINPREDKLKDMDDISKIKHYFAEVNDPDKIDKVSGLYFKILEDNKSLKAIYSWNQPMISNNGTFICGFSVAKNHFSIAWEKDTLNMFDDKFVESGYELLKKGIKIKWTDDINEALIDEAVKYTMERKKDSATFFAK